jgi:release factor glutamine methyltransferase
MTITDALTSSRALLTDAAIENPRLEAQLLLAWALRARREDLVREPERVLTERERLMFDKAVELRAQRRPLAYITGERGFYGRDFKINRAVLIPRWETELLVTRTLERLRDTRSPMIADIGTGSGCIAVTLASERADATVYAVDLSRLALLLAKKNIVRHGVQGRVHLLEGDLLSPLPRADAGTSFDAIVSNPPYIPQAVVPTLQPEVRDYEPALALSGDGAITGSDGIGLYPEIFRQAWDCLKPGGWTLVEIGQGQSEAVMASAIELGYEDVAVTSDYSDIPRVVEARKPLKKD